MQYIKARTTEKYNRAHGRTGTLWNERFKCRIIEQSENPVNYLLWLLWYIAYNPVRKGVIKNPRESSHGGILAYLHEDYQGRLKITHHRFFMELGDTFAQRVRAFLQFELSYKEYLIYKMGSEP
jgi:putative transposase